MRAPVHPLAPRALRDVGQDDREGVRNHPADRPELELAHRTERLTVRPDEVTPERPSGSRGRHRKKAQGRVAALGDTADRGDPGRARNEGFAFLRPAPPSLPPAAPARGAGTRWRGARRRLRRVEGRVLEVKFLDGDHRLRSSASSRPPDPVL